MIGNVRFFTSVVLLIIILLTGSLSSAGELFALKGDLNGDGIVNLLDIAVLSDEWLQPDCGPAEDLMRDAIFTRDSIAFLDGKEYVPDAPRRKLLALCGISDLEIHGEEDVDGVGPVTLAPKCTAGGYIYATQTDHANIYRSSDGINWEQTTDSLTKAYMIYGTQSGAILVCKAGGGYMTLYRSTAGGSDLTNATLPVPSLILPTSADGNSASSIAFWSFHQAKNGTICVNEYGSSGYPAYERDGIFRSTDDGISFAEVYDEPNHVKHSHRVIKHEATGRWVNVYGDGSWINKVVKSDDDGITWSTLDPPLDSYFQPVEFYDYGHPTNLLYGSDAVAFIGTFDVMTAEVTPLYADGDRIVPYIFSIFYHDGVFYAGTYSSETTAYNHKTSTAILVGSDLKHWAVYHQFRNGEQTVPKFLGVFGGKIHGIVKMSDGTWRHCSFTPTTVSVVNGLCLDPATTNMLDNEQLSSVEVDTSGWSASGMLTRITTDAVHGSACLGVEGYAGTHSIYSPSCAVTVGKTYSGRIRLKGNMHNQAGHFYWYTAGTIKRSSINNYFHLRQDEWTEIVLEPFTIEPNESPLKIRIRPRGRTEFSGPYDILFDAVQIEEGPPTRWQVGGTPRADEMLSKTVTTSQQWTESILWAPESRSEWYAGSGNQYIKSWYKDPNNYMELYFDPNDSTFALRPTIAGEAQAPIKTSAYTFYRNGVIRFVICCDENSLRLSVAVAGPFEHTFGPAVDFLKSATLTSKTGNYNGVGVMSGTFVSDKIYDGAM